MQTSPEITRDVPRGIPSETSHATPPQRFALLQPNDDHLGHQTAARMARPAWQDKGSAVFTERFWYMGAAVPAGQAVFGAGLGYYPHRDVMDCYFGVTVDGVQHSWRGSRRLGLQPLRTAVGPMRITVGEGMRSHRIELDDDGCGLSADLLYQAAFEPNDEGTDEHHKDDGLAAAVTRYVQMGHYQGWISVAGQRLEFGAGNPMWGARDRSWGLRIESRTDESHPPVTRFRSLFFAWVCAQFEDCAIHFFLKESAPGEIRYFIGDETRGVGAGKPARAISRVEHELQWQQDGYSQLISHGHFIVHFADGESRRISVRALPQRFFLKAGLYGGYRGWFQGDDRGPLHTEHTRWDHGDPATRRELRTLAEQVMEFSDGTRTGYGTIQSGVAPGYPRYTQIQHLPTM